MAKSKSDKVLCHYCNESEDRGKIYWVLKWAYNDPEHDWEYGVPCCSKCLIKEKDNYNSVSQEPKPPKTRKKKTE